MSKHMEPYRVYWKQGSARVDYWFKDGEGKVHHLPPDFTDSESGVLNPAAGVTMMQGESRAAATEHFAAKPNPSTEGA